jgi:predicted  nucleic acid-binding Zn-ribbon protein
MTAPTNRTTEQIRQDIEAERERRMGAVALLRSDVDRAAKKAAELKAKLPAAVVVAAGIGATMRYLARRRHR